MKPKLPKLHLRDLFWLVLVCAVACGWALDHQQLSAMMQVHADDWKDSGGGVTTVRVSNP